MPYITHADLADSPGALELSQVASDEHRPPVRAELLDAVLRGGDLADWPAEDVADAQRAVGRIDSAVRDAGSMIDGYLAKRGYAVPMDLTAASTRKLIAGWSRAIARYLLQKDGISDEKTSPIARDYRDAQRLLQATAEGKFSLGADDPQAGGSTGANTDVRFSFPDPVFSRRQLGAFR